jgi:PAS domain S-box-containing protein
MIVRPQTIDQEVKWNKKDFILSKTNIKGNITYVNKNFCDISGYSEKEILFASHSRIRHPDMPKAIFQLTWKYLLSGRAISVIIKNLAKSGAYYWVIADLKPRFDKDGNIVAFTSFQKMAPSSAIKNIQPLYETLKRIEKQHEIESSREYLNGFLEEKKMTYDGFIHDLIKPKGLMTNMIATFKKIRA